MPTRDQRRWLVAASVFVIVLLVAGSRFSFSVFFKPMQEDLGWDRATLSLAVSIQLLVYALAQPLVGRLLDRIGARPLMIAGVILTAGSGVALYGVSSFPYLLLFFGVLTPIGFAAGTLVTGGLLLARWFEGRVGTAVGLVSAAVPTGQTLFIPIIAVLIAATGWRSTFAITGLIVAAVGLPLLLLVVREAPEAAPGTGGAGRAGRARAGEGPALPLGSILAAPAFWLLAGSFFACGFVDQMIVLHLIPLATDAGVGEFEAARAFGFMTFMGIVGTLAIGRLSDRVSRKLTLAGQYALRAAALPLLLLLVGGGSQLPLYLFGALFGLTFIATYPPTQVLVIEVFGRSSSGTVMGGAQFAHQLGGAAGIYLAGWWFDRSGSYALALVAAVILSFGATWASLALREERPGVTALAEPGQRAL